MAKQLYNALNVDIIPTFANRVTGNPFPELKESEDERMRNAAINACKYMVDNFENSTKQYEDAIAWLEKKGEQKPVEFKPSFRVGDVIKPKDPVLGEPRIVKGIHPKFGYDTNNGILDFEFEDNWELVEQKPADKVEPKFHEGDKIRRKTPSSCDKDMQVARIEKDYYICNHIGKFSSEVVPFSKESSYELVEHKPVVSLDENGEPILTSFEAELFSMMSDAWQNYSLGEEVNIAKIVKEHSEELLERANEQKPTDKVEPKFHEGDWPVSNLDRKARQISEVHFDEYNSYYVVNGQSVNLEEYDRLHHLWTIQDAKDGDVLANSNIMCMFQKLNKEGEVVTPFIYTVQDGFEVLDKDTNTIGVFNLKPATKEQRALLFAKMKEAGYEWDAEKKELKKIEQKQEWSEEDKKMLKKSIKLFDEFSGDRELGAYTLQEMDCRNCADWLRNQKDKVQPQQEILEKLEEWLDKYVSDLADVDTASLICSFTNYLDGKLPKSLKDKVQPQNKWKESLATADLENSLCDIQDAFSDTSYEYRTLGEAIEFIRCTESKPQWKPSDEQMTQLKRYCPDNRPLTSLYEQLKKLREN